MDGSIIYPVFFFFFDRQAKMDKWEIRIRCEDEKQFKVLLNTDFSDIRPLIDQAILKKYKVSDGARIIHSTDVGKPESTLFAGPGTPTNLDAVDIDLVASPIRSKTLVR